MPTASALVREAVADLGGTPGGSGKLISRAAIKAHLDGKSTVARINMALKVLTENGILVQEKQSFKLAPPVDKDTPDMPSPKQAKPPKPKPRTASAGARMPKKRGWWMATPKSGMPVARKTTTATVRCACGGLTGVLGTAEGAKKWRAHLSSKKHQDYEEATW